ncbi:GNAT family N-acetyltransferase [Arenivirga flava]|uniref:N-acetyltransferase domain-containing protein n=1 Tax=Arenivirga flava TaxID=1930060 RepID=A0AA37ULI1_9MICO|nr:GNAT family N-acetyltransferase [Arenivirga flava]GMA28707.1 hypothetical protein GCM10025874_19600 [Arenivirga flava]
MSPAVRAAARGDVPAVAELLAASLTRDAFFAQLLPDPTQDGGFGALQFFSAYAMTHLGRDRALDVVVDDDERVLGVAAWTYRPRGRSSLVSRQTGLSVRYLRSIGPRRLIRAVALRRGLEYRRPHGTHWWLSAIAVSPVSRGGGLAKTLLQHRLARIDAAGEAAYAEATDVEIRELLLRFRFLPHETPGIEPDYPMQSMTREPYRAPRRYD